VSDGFRNTRLVEWLECPSKSHAPSAMPRVKRSLYTRAVGYNYEAVKIFMPANREKPVYAKYIEHIPPDVTAGIFWLKNRDPQHWRDTQFSVWDTRTDAEEMATLQPMLDLAKIFVDAGVRFDRPISNHETLWMM
jgi:hypothetical protein